MKTFMNLPAGAPANDMNVVIEGNLLRLYFGYEKDTTKAQATGENGVINGDTQDEAYSCTNIDIKGGSRTYGELTAAIIADKYDSNSVQAIIANKALADDAESEISDQKRTEYKEEYSAFQEYRAKAKKLAKKALSIINGTAEATEDGNAESTSEISNNE